MRRSIAPRSIHSFSIQAPSRARIQPSGRRKQLITPRSTRSLTTTSSQPQEQTSSTNPPQLQPQPSPSSSTAPRPSQWDTLIQTQRPHGTNPSTSPEARQERDQRLKNILFMIPSRLPGAPKSMNQNVLGRIDSEVSQATHDSLNSVHLRLTPMLGRTLPVEPGSGLDLQSAFRLLEMRCMQNKVRTDHYTQRVHVRRGQRRKELRSKRWRALFKEGFLRDVGRIRRMKGQGW